MKYHTENHAEMSENGACEALSSISSPTPSSSLLDTEAKTVASETTPHNFSQHQQHTLTSKVVTTAEIPSQKYRSEHNVFQRIGMHGGPITVASIRFPPTSPSFLRKYVDEYDDNEENTEKNHGNIETNCKQEGENSLYNTLKMQGRVVFARGPWIESHILFSNGGKGGTCSDDYNYYDCIKEKSASILANFRNGPIDVKTYKILAFGGNNDGGNSTFEGIQGMLFPSSSSDLSSVRDFDAESMQERNVRNEKVGRLSHLASIVTYGGRRLGFLSGGGLWDGVPKNNNEFGSSKTKLDDDDFATIPICKTLKKGKEHYASYLEVSDWIHDARMLDKDWNQNRGCPNQSNPLHVFLVALGMANNFCEIWGFHTIAPPTDMSLKYTNTKVNEKVALVPTILQCITCEVRCMTYSMSFFGWDQIDCLRVNNKYTLPSLVAASGTVFGEILIWGAVSDETKGNRFHSNVKDEKGLNETTQKWVSSIVGAEDGAKRLHFDCTFESSKMRVGSSHRLKGHLGSIYALKFWKNGTYIASASDDRSVRLWKLTALENSNRNNTNLQNGIKDKGDFIIDSQSFHSYTLIWTGWGHTARVWDVAFAPYPSNADHRCDSLPILISAGEDSTARLWSPLTSDKEIAYPLRGHRCESVWYVDACEGIIITGGNEGCIKMWDLKSRVRRFETSTAFDNLKRDMVNLPVPKDKLVQSDSAPTPKQEKELYSHTLDKYVHQTDSKSFIKKQKKNAQKKKNNSKGQIICGIEFFSDRNDEMANRLLIATRAGGCFSLNLVLQSWEIHNNWNQSVFSFNDAKIIDLDPSTGSCIGVHPSGKRVLIGTTVGWIVIATLSTNGDTKNFAFCCPSYRPAQSISWIDCFNFLVFYACGAVIWWQLDSAARLSAPKILHIMTLGTSGIPLCHAFDSKRNNMFIGDSRGNIAFFNLNRALASRDNQDTARNPDKILSRVHDKEHVTGITILVKSGVVLSVGNDGCMHQSVLDHGDLRKLIRIPIPNVSGLRHVWNVRQPNGDESAVIGGYYGNDFVVFDSILGYEFLRISTGGRQRRQDLFFGFANNSRKISFLYGAAVVVGHKDGSNSINFHFSHQFNDDKSDFDCIWQKHDINEFYNIGHSVHSETVNDACWVECGQSTYLLTGSNDCLVKLSKFENDQFICVAELPPHESCVRGVCSSCHKDSSVSLLVTCGGKLSMEFYLLDHQTTEMPEHCTASINSNVSFLCSYRTLAKSTIHHRMNIVRAIPLLPADSRCHLCLAGDSDGVLHLVVISELGNSRGTTIGNLFSDSGRPVLCIDLLRCYDRILAFVGTTSGDISVWNFPGTVTVKDGDCTLDCLEGVVPHRPIFVFKAHHAGVNDLSVGSLPISSKPLNFCINVCSVSDDQTISICTLYISVHSSQLWLERSCLTVLQCASDSPLKSIKLVLDQSTFHQIYVSGHDEQISLFKLITDEDGQPQIKFVSSSPLGTDGSCLAFFHFTKQGLPNRLIVAAGGEGVDILSLDFDILHAAKVLTEANYLLITAGAGFSADSGLKTYEDMPVEYRDFCDPSNLIDKPVKFQQFWIEFSRKYLYTTPHRGYNILDEWCKKSISTLRSNIENLDCPAYLSRPWYVYTSNVDGHFRSFASFQRSLCEIHGVALELKCACGIGYSDGKPRLGSRWMKWNESFSSLKSCKEEVLRLNSDVLEEFVRAKKEIVCHHCNRPMRPNVLMFHDSDENVLRHLANEREKYQAWEERVEDDVVNNNRKLVILELGCGVNVPAVRKESEEVLVDCTDRIRGAQTTRGSASLIRINPKNAEVTLARDYHSISIYSKAAIALTQINRWLAILNGNNSRKD